MWGLMGVILIHSDWGLYTLRAPLCEHASVTNIINAHFLRELNEPQWVSWSITPESFVFYGTVEDEKG